ncbi:hypothetical protein AB0D71_30045, partial [Streptomyces avermitilis]|uniref:hypothetical protein n=1 Tax=Streptomyces avermitilis TaxID=33903 RepID=UPI00340E459C
MTYGPPVDPYDPSVGGARTTCRSVRPLGQWRTDHLSIRTTPDRLRTDHLPARTTPDRLRTDHLPARTTPDR